MKDFKNKILISYKKDQIKIQRLIILKYTHDIFPLRITSRHILIKNSLPSNIFLQIFCFINILLIIKIITLDLKKIIINEKEKNFSKNLI